MGLEEEQGVTTEARRVGLDSGGRAALAAGQLAEAGAGDEALVDGRLELGAAQPVGGREGL